MTVKRVVIDSSVALKWKLRDEETLPHGRCAGAGRLALVVPTLFDDVATS